MGHTVNEALARRMIAIAREGGMLARMVLIVTGNLEEKAMRESVSETGHETETGMTGWGGEVVTAEIDTMID